MNWREIALRRWLWRLPDGNGEIALTFDDGPHQKTTPLLLDELTRCGIPATHFLLGEQCGGCEELVKRMESRGDLIANHGQHHDSFLFQYAAQQRQSIVRASDAVRKIIGFGTTHFRPCYGRFNFFTRQVLRQTEHSGVLWSVMVNDWIPQNEELLWTRLVNGLHDGAIIVLHDGRPTTPQVIRLLPRLAEELHRRRWRFTLLPNA